jgi:RNA polymerase sigma-70 factor (ECF subfamily)
MRDITDEYIICLFREKKQEKAFRLLVDKYKERLYWHVRKILISHEDADDILQNSFVKIWQGLEHFRFDSQLYTWMYRIATNEALNFLQEKRRKVYGNSDEISDFLINTLESDLYFGGDDIQKELQRAILTLSDRQRVVFNMRYYDDMSYEEIAQILNVTIGTLKATYHNAVKKIETKLNIVDTLD